MSIQVNQKRLTVESVTLHQCALLTSCDTNRPDTPESFDADLKALQAVVPSYTDTVYAITVGSETLYRGNFTGDQLLSKINQVKGHFPDVKVGTADSWNKYADGTADPLIKGGVKYLYVSTIHSAPVLG